MKKLKKFFSAEAFEQRARDRERRRLRDELSHMVDRQPFIVARLVELSRDDSVATLEAGRLARYAQVPA